MVREVEKVASRVVLPGGDVGERLPSVGGVGYVYRDVVVGPVIVVDGNRPVDVCGVAGGRVDECPADALAIVEVETPSAPGVQV